MFVCKNKTNIMKGLVREYLFRMFNIKNYIEFEFLYFFLEHSSNILFMNIISAFCKLRGKEMKNINALFAIFKYESQWNYIRSASYLFLYWKT